MIARKEDVLKIERLGKGWRAKNAGIGALIGFGGGFAVGAAVGGCNRNSLGPCISRGEVGALAGAIGLVVGAGIGALFHARSGDVIYTVE